MVWTGADEAACRRIASLVREWLAIPVGQFGKSDLWNAIDAKVARLYDGAP
jgi:hypothetical protein